MRLSKVDSNELSELYGAWRAFCYPNGRKILWQPFPIACGKKDIDRPEAGNLTIREVVDEEPEDIRM
jgi:hypothetical protein